MIGKTLKRDPKALAFADAILILAPLLIFLFILLLNGEHNSLLQKAEWSFVMVFYLVEVIRDQIKRQHMERYHEDHTEAGVVFYSLVLSFGVLFLYADFQHSQGFTSLDLATFHTIKICLFIASFSLFLFHRHKKYKHLQSGQQAI